MSSTYNRHESKYFNTALVMQESLLQLLETKDFGYITVSEICKKAGVNRSTFYLHYTNTYDLLLEAVENLNKKFEDEFKNIKVPDIKTADKKDLIFINHDFLYPYLNYLKKNKKVFLIAKSKPDLLVTNTYEEAINNVISPILTRFNVSDKEKKYMTAFYINGLQSLVMEWVKNNCEDEIEYIINLIVSYVGELPILESKADLKK